MKPRSAISTSDHMDIETKARIDAHKLRVKNAIKLGRVPSNTEQGKSYDIMLGSDDLVYCTCTGWEVRHKCSHLDAFKEALRRNV